MSGEYYCNEESVAKYHKDYEVTSKSTTIKENFESTGQDLRLHEIEEQLEMAEDRCNTLKGQLDYMKRLYGVNRKSPKIRKISNISPDKKSPEDKFSGTSVTAEGNEKDSRIYLKRQNSNAIGTDNTGAAVRTINNILNGITDSVNRLSELHVQISDTPRNKKVRSTGVSPHPITAMKITSRSNDMVDSQRNASFEDDSGNVQDTTADASCAISNKSRSIKKRSKQLNRKPVPSQQSVRKNNRLERKARSYPTKSTALDKSVTTMMKKRVLNSLKPAVQSHSQAHKLVEIYHNIAAKNSDSDEGNPHRSRVSRLTAHQTRKYTESRTSTKSFGNEVPPIDIKEKAEGLLQGEGEGDAPAPHFDSCRSTEHTELEPLHAPRTEISCYSKNYELPTIASRMKQVAKSYLNSFTFKAIPFCAAISTSPSHNIGINIQQVMNIIKNRQPIKGISPTLAHNIGLAAERLNSRPLSALVSSIHSKTGYRMSPCPLSKTFFNYPQLQEMARGIPEETAEEIQEEVESPEVKTIIITGPSGDMEVKNRNVPVWAADPMKSEQCTCVPQSGVELQHVVNKYRRPLAPPTAKSLEVEGRLSRYNNLNRRKMPKKFQEPRNGYTVTDVSSNNTAIKVTQQETPENSNPLQGKEKNLKEVLTNLHDEFETLNKKYEDLSTKASAEDEETLRELEKMELELSKKEEEITMVMSLYKEVIALKQQIKNLKDKASQGSVNVNASDIKFKEYNNPQAAFHLTKLLRQIQHYQMRYKRDLSGA